jgi:crotonobetainyl-CoA:carnitine CoA-transferase CaiB-like acyl-CoA transferase
VTVVGSPLRLDGRRPRPHDAPPTLGQHTDEVLLALGLTTEQIEDVTRADRG